MDWKNPENELPAMAKRVLVETEHGSHLFARRVVHPDNPQQFRWIDDQSLPIRYSVVRWTELSEQ